MEVFGILYYHMFAFVSVVCGLSYVEHVQKTYDSRCVAYIISGCSYVTQKMMKFKVHNIVEYYVEDC